MTEQMPQYPATSGPTPPGTAGPPQVSPKKEWPWLLIAGIGCLALLGLVVLLVVLGAAVFWGVRSSSSSLGPALVPPGTLGSLGTPHSASPYAYEVHSWSSSFDAELSDQRTFEPGLESFVFDTFGGQAQGDLGRITKFDAEVHPAADARSGTLTVELKSDDGKAVKLTISFKQQPEGGWEFTLDKYEGP